MPEPALTNTSCSLGYCGSNVLGSCTVMPSGNRGWPPIRQDVDGTAQEDVRAGAILVVDIFRIPFAGGVEDGSIHTGADVSPAEYQPLTDGVKSFVGSVTLAMR